MKLYVASSWRNPLQPDVVTVLRGEGHEVYDFRHPHATGPLDRGARGVGFHWSEVDPEWEAWSAEKFRACLAHPRAQEGFQSDRDAMAWADVGVLVLPAGRSAHLELGWMAGAGKPTVILLVDGEPELMYLCADYLAVSVGELCSWLTWTEARITRTA